MRGFVPAPIRCWLAWGALIAGGRAPLSETHDARLPRYGLECKELWRSATFMKFWAFPEPARKSS
ncbi:protein of unknown function [Methylocella tundrae]|uniref:Uncharacterized protein n=1 Tax=Methylocella tundrae TaxID=227605 RepID=A0A4U8Z1T0_METTU|nr:protein of unknown function [Methylocella tundrae]